MTEMEPTPTNQTALERLRTVTADVLRPVPYSPAAPPPQTPRAGTEEKPNFPAALYRGKWLLLAATALGAIYGTYQVIHQVPLYGSSTTLELMTPNTSFMGQGRYDPQSADSYMVNNANLQTQIRILLGPALLRRARERVSLESAPVAPSATGLLARVRNRLQLVPQDNMAFLRASIASASHSTSAHQIGNSKLIQVDCLSISAETAASYLNAVASEFIAQSQQGRSSQSTRTLQWISTQLEDAKARMDDADTKLQDFLRTSGRAFVLEQTTLDDSKLKSLQTDLASSQSDRIAKQTRYELAKSSPVDSLSEILDDGTLKGLEGRITALRQERAQLTATLTPSHYKVQRVDSQIAELEKTLQTEKGNLVRRIQNEYEAAQRRERLMTDAYNRQTGAVAAQTDKSYQYTNLKRSAETERTGYNLLLQQYNDVNVLAAVPANSVRVIDAAVAVYRPVKPQPSRDVGFASFAGFALAAVFLTLRELITVKKRSRVFAAPGASGQVLNVPELGILPAFANNGASQKSTRFAFREVTPEEEPGAVDGPLTWAKESFLAESIRHAFASIRARNADGAHRIYVVASASSGEGKTALTANLGIAMAEAGQRVLLIDADLRAPQLASVLHLNAKAGLSDSYTAGEPIAELPLNRYILPTGIPNLFVLPSGEADMKTVGELPFSRRLRELFARLRKEYDYILVDTPPSLQFSDARLLGQISDGVILVIRSAVSSRDSVSLTVQRFEDDGVPIVGTILNHWRPERGNSAYHDYFNKGYRSQQKAAPKA